MRSKAQSIKLAREFCADVEKVDGASALADILHAWCGVNSNAVSGSQELIVEVSRKMFPEDPVRGVNCLNLLFGAWLARRKV